MELLPDPFRTILAFVVVLGVLVFVHELGHYVEAKRSGLDPQLPVFIPFLGAYVALRNMRFDPWVNARVSLAGPVAGGIGALHKGMSLSDVEAALGPAVTASEAKDGSNTVMKRTYRAQGMQVTGSFISGVLVHFTITPQ